jgi:hypothetical protein
MRLGNATTPGRAAVVAVLLMLPSILSGFQFDDHVHRLSLRGDTGLPLGETPLRDLYTFAPADPEALRSFREYGLVPWWTPLSMRLYFFRPVAAATHLIDYALWGDQPIFSHAHSLLWLAALIGSVGLLYRELFAERWQAGLATLLFSVEDAHALPAAWIAQRNGLIAATLGVLALIAHVRWRRGGPAYLVLLSMVGFAGALFAGEAALAALGFAVAYEWVLASDSPKRRLMALVPWLLVLAPWVMVYVALQVGSHHSGLYIAPHEEPLAFLYAFVQRAPLLLFAQFFGIPSELDTFLGPVGRALHLSIAIVLLLCAALILARVVHAERRLRFLAVAVIVAVVPVCATFPNDRLLLFVSIPALGLVALLLVRWQQSSGGVRALLNVWLVVHLPLALILAPLRSLSMMPIGGSLARAAWTAPVTDEDRTLVVLNSPDALYCNYSMWIRRAEGIPGPAAVRCLGTSQTPVTVMRTGPRTLELKAQGGYLQSVMDRLFRSEEVPFSAGDDVDLSDMTIRILEVTEEGRPLRVSVTANQVFEMAPYDFAVWEGREYEAFELPKVGETVEIVPVALEDAIL